MELDRPTSGNDSTPDKIERYKQRLIARIINVLCAVVCLSALTWAIPAITGFHWTQQWADPALYVWLALVIIGFVWQLYATLTLWCDPTSIWIEITKTKTPEKHSKKRRLGLIKKR